MGLSRQGDGTLEVKPRAEIASMCPLRVIAED